MNEASSPTVVSQAGSTTLPTVVTCIESGRLEIEVPLMIASLREFGGELARSPVIVVSHFRTGVPLQPATKKLLAKLDAQLVPVAMRGHRYSWWPFFNKPLTLLTAAPHIKTPFALWLDGDIVVAKPPEEFLRHPEYDIQACVEDMGTTSTGPDSEFEPFWARMAKTIGVPLDNLPWVTTPGRNRRIRIYFNSGVFRYRMGAGFEQSYLQTVENLLDAKFVARNDPTFFLFEQISMGLAVARLGLKFQELPPIYNFHVEEVYESLYPVSTYPDAVLMHYHRGLRDHLLHQTLAKIRTHRPDIAQFIEANRPFDPSLLWKIRSIPRRFRAKAVDRKEAAHLAGCERV